MSEPFIGEIKAVAFNFAPRGWSTCAGQLLDIQQNTALFSLLGTMYGGDGRRNFALPNLVSRCMIGAGSTPGLSPKRQGMKGGMEYVSLNESELPQHSHGLYAYDTVAGDSNSPAGSVLAKAGREKMYETTNNPNVQMKPTSIGTAGSGAAHYNMMPYLAVNYVIALVGLFPSRS